MTALVDTSVLVLAQPQWLEAFTEPWAVSIISIGELETGVLRAADSAMRANRLALLTGVVERAPVLPVESQVANQYARLRRATDRKPSNDLWIAATAMAHRFILLTADEKQAALPGADSQLIAS